MLNPWNYKSKPFNHTQPQHTYAKHWVHVIQLLNVPYSCMNSIGYFWKLYFVEYIGKMSRCCHTTSVENKLRNAQNTLRLGVQMIFPVTWVCSIVLSAKICSSSSMMDWISMEGEVSQLSNLHHFIFSLLHFKIFKCVAWEINAYRFWLDGNEMIFSWAWLCLNIFCSSWLNANKIG